MSLSQPGYLHGIGASDYGDLAVDPEGNVVFTAIGYFPGPEHGITYGLFRCPVGAARSEQVPKPTELAVGGFAIESDVAIIATATFNQRDAPNEDFALYRIHLDTGREDLLYDSEALPRWGGVALDPAGRVLISDLEHARIMRIDLAARTEDVFQLPPGFRIHDMKVRIIPEPTTGALLLLGLLGPLSGLHRR